MLTAQRDLSRRCFSAPSNSSSRQFFTGCFGAVGHPRTAPGVVVGPREQRALLRKNACAFSHKMHAGVHSRKEFYTRSRKGRAPIDKRGVHNTFTIRSQYVHNSQFAQYVHNSQFAQYVHNSLTIQECTHSQKERASAHKQECTR